MTPCPCGATGFYDRRDLAKHIVEKHGTNGPRALMLAQKVVDRAELTPEECAVVGITPEGTRPPVIRATSAERRAALARIPGLPDDAALDQVVADKTAAEPEFNKICSNCNQNPATPGKAWCDDCREVARKRSSGRRTKVTAPATTTVPEPPVALAAVQDPARVAQLVERRPSRTEAVGSSPAPRSTPTPAPPAISSAPKEIPMATTKPCKLCARVAPEKCKRHGGASQSKSKAAGKKATGGGKHSKKRQEPAVRNGKGGGLDARAASMLTSAKTRVTQLRADLAAEEKRVEVLTELVGA